jgi:DNA helicase-2/ATP-dependent DNA helicase PcrA
MLSDVVGGLTDAQLQATTFDGRRLVVRGTAGTGKTRVLEARFYWLLSCGVAPERIAFVVPSAGRGELLRSRLETELTQAYEELCVGTPVDLAALVLGASESLLGAGERLAMLVERIEGLPLRHHDFGGNPGALLARFIREIDRLKAALVSADDYARSASTPAEEEFAGVYRAHEQLLAAAGARDAGDLVSDALRLARSDGGRRFEHVLVDDGHECSPAAASLVAAVGGSLVVAEDPRLAGPPSEAAVITLDHGFRCPAAVAGVASAVVAAPVAASAGAGEVAFWRCANERAQAQAVAAEIERQVARSGVDPGRVAVIVPAIAHEGQAVAVALEERAVPHRLVGSGALFQRVEIRDLLAWLRLLVDPTDAGAVVRALARPPIELRSIDIARCTQIARRRKLDMVAALAAATESPQVPPEARERIRVFLKLYRASIGTIDTARPDLYVHRLIERLGLRRQQLFAAQADVVQRLRALARFGELAAVYTRRSPQATPREFARLLSAIADFGLPEEEEPALSGDGAGAVQVLAIGAGGGFEADHVYVVGLGAGVAASREDLYLAVTRARASVVLCYAAAVAPCGIVEEARAASGLEWSDRDEELFGPAEALHSTYRLLRDELLEGTIRAAGRLGELRFDTDLDVSHAVVRYLELLKVAALIARPEGVGLADTLRDVNSRILQAVTAEQREIFSSSALDDYLLDAERDARRRAGVLAARDEPSLEAFLPKRGEGVVLSASDIDTYRTCPLKYKFARVFRIPQEPTLYQRFGIAVHQVLERFHASGSAGSAPADRSIGSLAEILGLLDAAWRRGGFGDSEEERQLRGKAVGALTRYHERCQSSESEPVWFERQFTFKLGPHVLRGRVDRVDRLPDGEYELIDYKTGRPKSAAQLVEDVQLSLYAVGAREAWRLDASRQAYYYVLDDQKVSVPGEGGSAEWILDVASDVADGILSQGFEPTPSVTACSICDYRLVCPAAER